MIGVQSRLLFLVIRILGAACVLGLPWMFSSSYDVVLLNMALMYSVVVLGLNFIYGFAGILSVAQAAFWGIGAYTSALLTVNLHLPVFVGLVTSGIVTTAFGLLLGVPTLRLKALYLIMATLGFAEAVRMVLMNFEQLTYGAQGIRNIPVATFGPIALDTPHKFYYFNLLVLALVIVCTVRLGRSRIGRALTATRDDELAAGATGVNVTYARVLAFAISAFWGGIAGGLWAHFFRFISPESFDLLAMIRFMSMIIVGGPGTVAGPIVGTVLLTYLPEWLRVLEAYYMAIYGLSIVAFLIFAPGGLVGLTHKIPPLLKIVAKRWELSLGRK